MEGSPEVGTHAVEERLRALESPTQERVNYISIANANANDINATEVSPPYPDAPSFVHANLTETNLVAVFLYWKGPGAPENPSPRHTIRDITEEIVVTEGGEIASATEDFALLSDTTCIVFYHPSQP